jgi:hypothetical protein
MKKGYKFDCFIVTKIRKENCVNLITQSLTSFINNSINNKKEVIVKFFLNCFLLLLWNTQFGIL